MTEYTAEEFAAECERSAADGPDLRPALTVCRDIILDGIADNFLRQQSSEGVKWPARKANSLRCGFHPLLQLSGALKGAADGPGEGHIERFEDDSITVGVEQVPGIGSLMGARRHQWGDEDVMGRPGILARPFVGISDEVADKCAEAAGRLIAQGVF